MSIKNLIILPLLLFCSFISSQKLNDEIFIIYKLKSEKTLNKSKKNSLKNQTIYGNSKSENLHSDFEKDLIKFGYKKVEDLKSNQIFEKLNSLKNGKNSYDTACLKVYRDILIYKNQNNKIIKIIKICTSCYANQVITPKSSYELLMNFEDYDFLDELL
ncbi:hypothetical protein [Chryseobacterium luquanense]|uniref:Uncharacterized protein n=1 Tax=Chryseobacterium luquanense TaxID=2983766 RepID=A0ABT3Y5D2_9FLAO|nr:hypothetical protein [Chryseobacterium luquanense]MCX8533366.1 hypothetical protein [Chryseobacterium luquanense]